MRLASHSATRRRLSGAWRESGRWWLAGLALVAAGCIWIARFDLAQRREVFDTDARIAHRLLSQRAVEHDTILATLALLQPGANTGDAAPEQRLPALYPQLLRVLRRDRDGAWPDAALQAAQALSRSERRSVLAQLDLAQGRYTLVRAAEPASFALQIDLQRMVPWNEWPIAREGPVQVALEYQGQMRALQGVPAGQPDATSRITPNTQTAQPSPPGWRFEFRKALASDSQPFDIVLQRALRWGELPWGRMAFWAALVGAVFTALVAWQRQRSARLRAEALLRLGQVGRLNALGELAAGMAHELNQPLTALLANTQAARRLLDDEMPDVATARSAMAQAAQQARRAAEVVGRLRRVVERPELAAAPQPLVLADVVRDVLELLGPECRRRDVAPRLQLDAEGASLAVRGDPVALQQIVHNLLMNALQALEQVPAGERSLWLQVQRDGASGLLSVRDSGPGIAADALPRVFEPFFSTRRGGLGLGLSLCETLAQAMGGSLTCRNAAPHGAEFRLALPRAQ